MEDFLVELNRQNQAKQDFISPAQGMRLREDGQTFEINHLTTSQQEVFGTTSLFHRQVASALGIPAKYYDLMQAQKPELLAENVNSWFAVKLCSYMVFSMDYGAGQVARVVFQTVGPVVGDAYIVKTVAVLIAGDVAVVAHQIGDLVNDGVRVRLLAADGSQHILDESAAAEQTFGVKHAHLLLILRARV